MKLENRESYPDICHKILDDMSKKLPDYLTYHSLEHTIDMANVCNRYIDYYMVSDRVAELIRIAAVSHDYGYIYTPVEHEERSIKEIRPLLKAYSDAEISLIEGMIRATRVPQQTHNLYEDIMADSDLDYLGRDDYRKISDGLFKEFLHFGVVSNETDWVHLQIKFLENHTFHTDWAKLNRGERKSEWLKELHEKARSLEISKKAS